MVGNQLNDEPNLYLNHGCLGYHENLKVVELSWISYFVTPVEDLSPKVCIHLYIYIYVYIYIYSFSRGRMAPTVTLKLLLVHIVGDFLRILPTMGFITINLTIWASHFCEESQIQELLQDFWNFHPETWEKISTWNAKCPIFKGNFTPKTSNYCLKNRVLGFPGNLICAYFFRVAQHQPDLGWGYGCLCCEPSSGGPGTGLGSVDDPTTWILEVFGIITFFDVGWWYRVAPHVFHSISRVFIIIQKEFHHIFEKKQVVDFQGNISAVNHNSDTFDLKKRQVSFKAAFKGRRWQFLERP